MDTRNFRVKLEYPIKLIVEKTFHFTLFAAEVRNNIILPTYSHTYFGLFNLAMKNVEKSEWAIAQVQ